ncbi:MAG: MgtC/SapB family protein [Deltaproteobacteria bacterium]|jgi:putative Mg2+ transporter-C (MgtC) family protein|nr:MgtC/SapB family protein [Deltaproteobacteria bacterium]
MNSYDAAILIRLLLASLLSGLIGIEREVHGRAAGFRTHLLVGIGACLMMIVSEYFFTKYGELSSNTAVRMDPARVAAQIVTGIGFLGAGVIIKSGQIVRGLTTAVCLWVVAGIGMAIGTGLYLAALIVTLVAIFHLLFLKQIEKIIKKDRFYTLVIYCSKADGIQENLKDVLHEKKMRIVKLGIEKDAAKEECRYEYTLSTRKDCDHEVFVGALSRIPAVKKICFN